jgi:hypothetical protein
MHSMYEYLVLEPLSDEIERATSMLAMHLFVLLLHTLMHQKQCCVIVVHNALQTCVRTTAQFKYCCADAV